MNIEQQRAIAMASARLRLKKKSEPAAFDPAFESQRAKTLTPDPYTHQPQRGVDIESQRPLIKKGIVNQQTLDATRRAVGEFDRRKDIAESGVELNTPLPVSSVGMGFTNNEALAVQTSLTDYYAEKGILEGQKAEVRYGPDSGVLEYKDPETNKWNIVNADMKSKAGYAIPVAGDIIGTVGMGMLGGANPALRVVGESTGSFLGTGAGEALRLAVGRAMGWNDLSTNEIISSALEEGAKAGVTTLAVGSTFVSVEALKNYLKGGGFSRRGALEAGMSDKQADAVVAEINNILEEGGKKGNFKPTVAQRSQSTSGGYDVSAGSVEAELRRHTEYAQEFLERDIQNNTAMNNLLAVTNSPYTGPNLPMDSVSNRLRAGVVKRVNQAKELFDGTVYSLKKALDSMEDIEPGVVGSNVRTVLEGKREVAKKAYKTAYKDFNLLAGTNVDTGLTNITLKVPQPLKALKVRFKRESDKAMVGAAKGGDKTLTFTDDAYNLADWNRALGELKSDARVAEQGRRMGIKSETNLGSTKLAIKKMEAARNKALKESGHEDVLEALLKAERERLEYADVYQRSFIGDILKEDGPGYALKNDKILHQIITAGPEDVDVLYNAISGNLQAKQAIRKGLNNLYKKQVPKGREIQPKAGSPIEGLKKPLRSAHKAWMDSHEYIMSKFFTQDEIKGMNSLVGMSKAITKHDKKLDMFIKDAEKTWGRGKLVNLDPDKIVDFIFNESSIIMRPTSNDLSTALAMPLKKVRWLKGWLKDSPAEMDALRANYAKRVSNAVFSGDIIKESALNDLLKNETLIRELMSDRYVDNLLVLQKGLNMSNKKFAKLSVDERKAALVQALRGTDFAAPLSQAGRRFTAFILFARAANHKIVKDALLNPEKLDTLAQVLTHNHSARKTAELAASIGFMIPEYSNIEPQYPQSSFIR